MHPLTSTQASAGSIAIHWFGQSTFALKDANGTVLLLDPFFPRERPPERFLHAEPPLDEATLRPDLVLLTHNHRDHTCLESLLRIHAAHPRAIFMGPHESTDLLAANEIPDALLTTVEASDSVVQQGVTVHAVWAKPPQGAPAEGIDPPDVTHLGFVIELDGVRVYVSGDPINSFAEHEELLAPIRELKPHIGFLTTHPSEGEFPFFDESVQSAVRLGLDAAVPAHYDCFVSRTYDPQQWAAAFPNEGPRPLIIPYNSTVLYSPA